MPATYECTVPTDDGELPGTVELPDGPVRAAVVVVHGSTAGHRSWFCYTHVGRVLTAHGVAVLRYDRRVPLEPGRDVPLRLQATDAAAAARTLRKLVDGDVPLGLWGLSQGAWAAPS
ncbi:alpha/beta hydrolase [Micromonospora sp. LOL_023]|uniref:alpha/beta hydrolase n=1 Tax=Micromonospora sp. LOL_023 TaxID=3345418 RepID=UPI003A89C990